ncbi:MAG: glycosyltransferase [Lachnospiraceae bacterium]|nr:glycosyltransferase [Lachnospiraceae bacterium]
MNSRVSIVVPVYNAAECIADTIASVLAQSYTDYELLLVDDGSSDDSAGIIGKYLSDRVRLLDNTKTKGAAGARNTGIEASSGRYIAFLDADDLWMADKLEKQVRFMEKTDAAFSFTGYEFADASGHGLGRVVSVPGQITYTQALKNTTIFTSTVMFDTEKTGRDIILMPDVKSEDTATWWKVLKAGFTGFGLDESLTLYRRMGKSLSSNKAEAVRRIWNLYRNVEHLGRIYSMYCFCFWAVRAVARRV